MEQRQRELEQFGPAMLKLSPLQRNYVIALLETGSDNKTYAARLAGYADNANTKFIAHRLSRDPNVLAAIKEETQRRFDEHLPLAQSVILEIASHGEKDADRLAASKLLLGLGGMSMVDKKEVTVVTTSLPALIERGRILAAERNIDFKQLMSVLKINEEIIDANFTEVPSTAVVPSVSPGPTEVEDDWNT